MKLFLSFFTAVAVILMINSMVIASVYKVVDDKGNITYTDTPPAETAASELVLPAINPISSSIKAPISIDEQSPESEDAKPVMAFTGYSFAVMVAPLNDSLVHFDQPNLVAQLALKPELQADHLVQFYVDGSAYGKAIPAVSLSISGLERGSHSISARVISPQGAVLAIAGPVTVHVQRHFKRN